MGRHLTIFTHLQGAASKLAWSPDGKRFATGNHSKTVQVGDATTGTALLTYRRPVGKVDVVAWSPDGKRIASGNYDGMVQVWDAS